jgi:hypothetical protein
LYDKKTIGYKIGKGDGIMDIVVLAGGLSTERDVSFVTGNMVSKALRKNGHRVILLDVFMGYSDKKEDISDIFEHTEEVSVQIEEIPTVAPDLAAVKASRADQSDNFFGPNVIEICQKADVVFMDPPRSGSSEKFLNSVIKLSPKKIVYISCNPETLARDLNFLTRKNYIVKEIQPVEMFCFTDHTEVVTWLEQK